MARLVSTAPLMAMAGDFTIRWPTEQDMLRIGLLLRADGSSPHRVWAVFLHVLADLPKASAQRLALAHLDTVAAVFAHVFRTLLDRMPLDDPRREDPIVATIISSAA